MGWGGELSQGLLLSAMASRKHNCQVLEGWGFFQYAFASFLQNLYFKIFRKNICIITFPVTGQSCNRYAFFYSKSGQQWIYARLSLL